MPENHNLPSGRRLRPSWIIIAVVVLAAVLYASLHHTTVAVRTEEVKRQDLTSAISTNGKVEPVQNFEAHAPAPISVLQVLVHEGDHVHRGDLLIRLDDSQARTQAARGQTQLKAAQAESGVIQAGGTRQDVLNLQDQLSKALSEQSAAQNSLNSLRKLQQTGAASAGEVAEAKARLDRATDSLQTLQQRKSQPFAPQDAQRVDASIAEAQASMTAAKELLQLSNIRSTIDGTVYQVPVHPGNFVNTGDLIVQVADLTALQVRAFVDEPEIGKLHIGEPVAILWDALPSQSWQGKVKTVPETVIPRGTRTVGEVVCTVQPSSGPEKLLPNVNVNVSIQVAHKENVLTVPREAVHQDNTGRFVLAVRDGRLHRVPVQTGISSLTRIEISGVNEGEVIAINSANSEPLMDGLYVRPVS